jgi:hypothetical protein
MSKPGEQDEYGPLGLPATRCYLVARMRDPSPDADIPFPDQGAQWLSLRQQLAVSLSHEAPSPRQP